MILTLTTFVLFTALVAVLTWLITRGKSTSTEEGFFLAGRSLTGVVIAGSLLLTNLSTEQLVGLNAGSFAEGLSVMAWEVIAGCSLVVLALFFLPRYLKSGIATIPQFLEERYDAKVRALTTGIFIIAYMLILLPFVLFSGASALAYMLNLPELLGLSDTATIWVVVAFIALVGSAYAIFGGLRAVAVSDTFNGLGLLIGGLMITWFSIQFAASDGQSISSVFKEIKVENPDAFVSLGKAGEDVHWPTLFTGVLILNFFYWCTNQQIIQRTFGAKNLAEGQKGVLLAAFFKILAPIILVLPGIVALHIASQNPEFNEALMNADGEREGARVYGTLVRFVLPGALTGFFAAVVVGSILSTFNSVLNSSATLFSLGVYKKVINKTATSEEVVKSGRLCSAIVAVCAAIGAPVIFLGQEGIFGYFQKLNGVYFIPLLSVILVGMFNKRVDGHSAFITILVGLAIMMWGTFLGGDVIGSVFGSGYHFMGAVFIGLVLLQLALGMKLRRTTRYVQADAQVVDLTPWKPAPIVGGILIVTVLVIYLLLAKG
ncbi:MAG: solute:sodium symporter family transporter [Verrucomicrobiales bacterium]|nr:solute:sodium symporter family transporter [Verrucomicrobiales bacterium]